MLDNLFHHIASHPIYLSIGTFVSEDLSYLYGLSLVQKKQMTPLHFIFFYSLGVVVGDLLLYGLGASGKFIPSVRKWLKKKNKPQESATIGGFETFLMLTRFLPGTRFVTYTYAGLNSYHILKFFLILTFSTLIQVFVGVILLSFFKGFIDENSSTTVHFLFSLLICLLSLSFLKLLTTSIMLKNKYREVLRPLFVLLTRKKSMEFWSPWTFYIPFAPKFLYLFLKYRGFSNCLNTNPAIYMSGFLGEKKSDIDKLLEDYIPDHSLRTRAYPQEDLTFPLVAKPDSGLRGVDVKKINTPEELAFYLANNSKDIVIQDLSPYENEWGAFYIRYPGKDKGEIFSITEKVLPKVIGTGDKSIYQLVMADPLFSLRFDWIFNEYKEDIHRVPLKGELVKLGFKGSHSKGCLFLDGNKHIPKAQKIALALDKIPDFYIGRADIKYESAESIDHHKFDILELNGAAAESTNFYDPSYSPLDIIRVLSKQWEHVFTIGSMNSAKMTKKNTIWNFLSEVLVYKGLLKKKSIKSSR